MELEIRLHVEDGTVKNKIVIKRSYLVPGVTGEKASVDEIKAGVRGLEVEGGERTGGIFTRLILCDMKAKAGASLEVRGGALEQGSDVLAWVGKESLEVNIRIGGCRGSGVEHNALHCKNAIDGTDVKESAAGGGIDGAEDFLEANGGKADGCAKPEDNEAQGDLLSPGLSDGLVLEAGKRGEEEVGSPKGDEEREVSPEVRAVVIVRTGFWGDARW